MNRSTIWIHGKWELEHPGCLKAPDESGFAGDSVMPDKLLKGLDMDFSQREFWQGRFKVIQNMWEELKGSVEN